MRATICCVERNDALEFRICLRVTLACWIFLGVKAQGIHRPAACGSPRVVVLVATMRRMYRMCNDEAAGPVTLDAPSHSTFLYSGSDDETIRYPCQMCSRYNEKVPAPSLPFPHSELSLCMESFAVLACFFCRHASPRLSFNGFEACFDTAPAHVHTRPQNMGPGESRVRIPDKNQSCQQSVSSRHDGRRPPCFCKSGRHHQNLVEKQHELI